MSLPGYSGTPLIKKLGIKPSHKVQLLGAPVAYFDWLGADISSQVVKSGGDFVHVFAVTAKELEKSFVEVIRKLPADGVVWISWYKKSARMPTDITEDTIREIVLPTGWVDVKVCAVSEQWSGLKIVKRLENR